MARKPILGTPLGSLLSTSIVEDIPAADIGRDATEKVISGAPVKDMLLKLPVERLQRSPYQPRREFDEESLQDLSDSIRSQGIIQPIIVRPKADQKHYEIIAGERRWRAAQMAGLSDVPVVVRDVNDETALALAIIENLQREDLNPLEEAMGLERLMAEFNLTHQDLAGLVGKSRTHVTNLLRLLSLRQEVKTMLEHNDIEMGHARALLPLDGALQVEVARTVVSKALSVRQTEALVRYHQKTSGNSKPESRHTDPDVVALQDRLTDVLCAKVVIKQGAKGKGKLIVEYSSLDELDGIISHIS